METGILILAMGCVGYVMWWLVRNDGVPEIRRQTGLLRMPPPAGEAEVDGQGEGRAAAPVASRPAPHGARDTDDVRWQERQGQRRRRRF